MKIFSGLHYVATVQWEVADVGPDLTNELEPGLPVTVSIRTNKITK